MLVERLAELVNTKVITDIVAVRDESDENTRVVIELKREAIPQIVVNNLYQHTALETTFSVNMLAIDHGRPKLLSIKDALAAFIEHRREVVLRRTRFLLRAAEERAEVLDGFLVALANMDDFIRIIRESANRDEARVKLLALEWNERQIAGFGIEIREPRRLTDGRYELSERQANAILELRLYQLTGLERDKITGEYAELMITIRDLMDIIANESRVLAIIKEEALAIKNKYATPRLTQIVPDEGEINMEDLIANEGSIITITHRGFIKRTLASEYRSQRRGGKGVIGMTTREGAGETDEDDFVEHLFTASTHDFLMFFTRTGRCYVKKVYELPEGSRTSKGRSIVNFLDLRPDEKIAATIRVQRRIVNTDDGPSDQTWDLAMHIVFATRQGIVKKTNLADFENVRKGGIIAIKIEEGDDLIEADLVSTNDELVLITREGMSLRFDEGQLRDQGRDTVGVWGIDLQDDDLVVAMAVVHDEATLLVVGETGIGKRTAFNEYRSQKRGGRGLITMKTGDKTGRVVGALTVTDEDELVLTTNKGKTVRTPINQIRETGRNTMGVKLIDLAKNEKLQDIARVVGQATDAEPSPAEPPVAEGDGTDAATDDPATDDDGIADDEADPEAGE